MRIWELAEHVAGNGLGFASRLHLFDSLLSDPSGLPLVSVGELAENGLGFASPLQITRTCKEYYWERPRLRLAPAMIWHFAENLVLLNCMFMWCFVPWPKAFDFHTGFLWSSLAFFTPSFVFYSTSSYCFDIFLNVCIDSFWCHFAIIWVSFWVSFWGHVGVILGSFWGHVGVILGF